MKNLRYIYLLMFVFTLGSCAKKIYTSPEVMTEVMDKNQFTFMAERANPMGMDVINVMNAFPGGGSERFLNLDYGYTLILKDSKLLVDLPYFGRLYTPNLNNRENSFKFETEDYRLDKTQNKKGNWVYKIVTNDQSKQITFYLEVYKNGRSYLNVTANDRQSISYDGVIKRNKPEEVIKK